MLQAIIFDLDGVLTDTAEYHFRAWKRLASEEGIPFTREDNEKLRGVSRRQSLGLLLKGRVVSEETMEEMMERKDGYYQEFVGEMKPTDVLPGVIGLVTYLRGHGIKTGLASVSKNTQTVVKQLKIGNLFDVIADGYSVERGKPEPDIFLYVANKLGVPPVACVVVEDAAAGVEGAQAAGMGCIGIGKAAVAADVALTGVGKIIPAEFVKRARQVVRS